MQYQKHYLFFSRFIRYAIARFRAELITFTLIDNLSMV